jgi:hypothetical protein
MMARFLAILKISYNAFQCFPVKSLFGDFFPGILSPVGILKTNPGNEQP